MGPSHSHAPHPEPEGHAHSHSGHSSEAGRGHVHPHVHTPAHPHGHAPHDGHAHAAQHAHGPTSGSRLVIALGLTLAFMAIEAVAGWYFHSLALLSDSVHMLGDAGSMALGAAAAVLAGRRASVRRTYGYKRVEVLAAFANALSLFWLSLWLGFEAVQRFLHPVDVHGKGVLAVAVLGLLVNVAMLFWLHHGEGERSLNEEGVIWHVIGDTISSLAAVAAGAWISLTGDVWVDPVLACMVVVILLVGAGRLLLRSAHVLIEGTPEGFDTEKVRADLLAEPQVDAVHDLHVWSLNGRDLYFSAHVVTVGGTLTEGEISRRLTRMLSERHHMDHITLQVGHCDDEACGAKCDEANP